MRKLLLILLSVSYFLSGCVTQTVVLDTATTPLTTKGGNSILQKADLMQLYYAPALLNGKTYMYLEGQSPGDNRFYSVQVKQTNEQLYHIVIESTTNDKDSTAIIDLTLNLDSLGKPSLQPVDSTTYLFSFAMAGRQDEFTLQKTNSFTIGNSCHLLTGEIRREGKSDVLKYIIVDDPKKKTALLAVCSCITIIDEEMKKRYKNDCYKKAIAECTNLVYFRTDFQDWFIGQPVFCHFQCK